MVVLVGYLACGRVTGLDIPWSCGRSLSSVPVVSGKSCSSRRGVAKEGSRTADCCSGSVIVAMTGVCGECRSANTWVAG